MMITSSTKTLNSIRGWGSPILNLWNTVNVSTLTAGVKLYGCNFLSKLIP